ncbi:MAG: hypothetical protein L6Q54_08500 [Leptospiraceae bacterium]|nr:hypothetical protein [Leptospiraceae bacterium]MCK6381273.1 hypothetical protein [Leptospiraceae bacterium]NUM41813.1 hypothetical protein [Leptospiraceae bacterium]
MTLLLIVQVLHILSGTIWICSFIFIYFFLWPSFVKNNSEEALNIKNSLRVSLRNIVGLAGTLSIALGIFRGVYYSGINSWESLFTPYGRTFLAANLITLVLLIVGRVYGHNLVALPWKDEKTKNKSLKKIYLAGVFILFFYILLLFTMVAMRFGGI